MKTHTILLLIASFLASVCTVQAQSFAGEDSARHYKSAPEKYDGQSVDVDCVFVTRINGGPQIDGVTFFVAHTEDEDNRARGGGIVVAVLEEDASGFLRKYGNTLDIDRGSSDRVDSKRLKGTFHQLARGHVYIDTTDGAAHSLILEHREDALGKIRMGDGGHGPGPGPGIKGKGKKF